MKWVWAIASFATLVVAKDINKVSVELEANWNSGPLYLEATEFIHSLKNDDVTIQFVKKISSHEGLCSKSNSEIITLIKSISFDIGLSEAKIKMMMFSMSLRFYSPKIQSALSIPSSTGDISCASYLLTDGPSCTLDNVLTGQPELISSDLVLRNASKMIILVGNPEQQNFRELLDELLGTDYGIAIRWSLGQHLDEHDDSDKTPLSGYGVELRMKSTEYKASDDSEKKDEEDEVEIERAAGFNFAKLKQRFPELQKEIKQFAKYVSDTSAEIQPMKAWQMGDLSLQAAQETYNSHKESNGEKTFETLSIISGNFPQQAKRLSRVQVEKKLPKKSKKIKI